MAANTRMTADEMPTMSRRLTDADELHALFAAGGVWGLALDWVPRGGFAIPARPVLRRVELGLLLNAAPWIGEQQ
ncbi:hypothetical protein OIE62_24645 [Streptomyces scopuliridis]|uniref:Uncharacterized protein n=1 Tax=Streptomyces scopuliridis TaxID=452529 RepID=A0ACD4ZIX3_9ACTN|nr:hypothetical protein [Streptomyces scopuliridis]WSB98432.1 hypothetical protein OG835_16300 [Streptomyces scopuliridis]WSC07867.1 hypothetical protein OIE62_24645 [Streptomyces scopuliridis]